MTAKTSVTAIEPVEVLIQNIRGKRVILDADLARLYGATTKRLNEAVKRNAQRFPSDFMFQLTLDEAKMAQRSRSQFATLKRGRNIKYLPHVFSEHGAIMVATVLNTKQAVQMSLFVVRAFVKLRETLATRTDLVQKLADLERNLTGRIADHEKVLEYVLTELRKLMNPPGPPRKQIGFHARERKAIYRTRRK